MGAAVRPERTYSPDNPFAQAAAGSRAYSPDNPFAAPSTGNIDLRAQAESTRVAPRPAQAQHSGSFLSGVEKAADAVVSGFPGAQRATAGLTGLLDLVTGQGLQTAAQDVEGSLQRQRANVASLPGKARIPLQMAGGAPAAAALAPLGLIGGSAAFGAAAGADQPASSLRERAFHTAVGGGMGAATGAAMRGASNLLSHTPIPDMVERGISKVLPNAGASMGTRGQVNEALGERQDVLDALKDTGVGGDAQQLARETARKAQAKVLYDAARADTRALQDPELDALLSDPQVQKAYQLAGSIREARGAPLQRVAAPEQVPLALQKMGVSPEQYQRLTTPEMMQSRRIGISGTEVLPPELLGEQPKGVEVPDPEVLHQVKRYLNDALMGRQGSSSAISQDEAATLAPKVEAIRNKLHELSPAWKEADAFYSKALGQEEAFRLGYSAPTTGLNPTAKQLTKTSPAALLQQITEPRYAGEPVEDILARRQAFQEGARAAAIQQIKGKPVDQNIASILKAKALAPTQNAQQVRALMFEQPQEAQSLNELLAQQRGTAMQEGGNGTFGHSTYPSHAGMLRSLLRLVTQEPNKIPTPYGQSLLNARLSDPATLQSEVGAFRHGTASPFLRTLGIDLGGQAVR